MTNISSQTLAAIVTEHHEVVPVLEKYNLDFCCKGKRSLSEACQEKGLNLEVIIRELNASTNNDHPAIMPFVEMTADQLIGYILIRHHFYVKQSLPTIIGHLEKIASKHGDNYPYMVEVLQLFYDINDEMLLHMQKEETILFPRIKEIESLSKEGHKKPFNINYISGPVTVMENEHDHAGEILYKIRELTNGYTPPETACTTHRVALTELKAFEEDLHQHVHLENNILFPMANKLLAAVSNAL